MILYRLSADYQNKTQTRTLFFPSLYVFTDYLHTVCLIIRRIDCFFQRQIICDLSTSHPERIRTYCEHDYHDHSISI